MVGWHPAPSSEGGAWRSGRLRPRRGDGAASERTPHGGWGGHIHALSRGAGKGLGWPSGEAVMGLVAVEAGSPRLWAANPCRYC